MKRIKLTQGKYTIVDDNMFEYLDQFKWYASKNKNTYYATRCLTFLGKRRTMSLHHLIIGYPLDKKQIDHINGDGLDNRSRNLRVVSNRENSSNRRSKREGKTSSKYVGVLWYKHIRKWRAKIQVNKKLIHLGYFATENLASRAYQTKLNSLETKP